MKIRVRRIGNSLGIFLPKAKLHERGVSEGDSVELTVRGLRAPRRAGFSQAELDAFKREISLGDVDLRLKWRELAAGADDGELIAAMLGHDDNAVRLRKSMPFLGLLSPDTLKRLFKEAASG